VFLRNYGTKGDKLKTPVHHTRGLVRSILSVESFAKLPSFLDVSSDTFGDFLVPHNVEVPTMVDIRIVFKFLYRSGKCCSGSLFHFVSHFLTHSNLLPASSLGFHC
jgi:hypothetical protein